jgi:hypothetical protein
MRIRSLVVALGASWLGCGEQAAREAPSDPPDPPPTAPVTAPVDPLRRLSPTQYDHTVADLFPGAEIPPQSLPADPLVHGFDNHAAAQTPSALLVEAWLRAATAVAAAAWERPTWLPCAPDGGPDPAGCAAAFVEDFGRRAFRRPLTSAEAADFEALLLDVFLADRDFGAAVQVTIQAFLLSPDFLFLPELGAGAPGERIALDGHAVAARLSYLLWSGPPDDALLDAAAAGALDDPDGIEAEARRMLADPRAERGLADFHRQWLAVPRLAKADPDPATYPIWDEELRASMREELDGFVRHVLFAGEGTLPSLLLDRTFTGDAAVARVYGVGPGDGELPAGERAGALTRAAWLTATAKPVHPSPVQRGIYVLDHLLCDPPPPPPANIDTSAVDAAAGDPRTNRERYEVHSTTPVCASCHLSIDGIGMGFEHYDSVGRFRVTDAGFPVDATATLASGDLDGASYDGALELSALLADSADAHRCYATHWLRYGLGRTEATGDAAELSPIARAFYEGGGDVPGLLIALVRSETFRTRAVGDAAPQETP